MRAQRERVHAGGLEAALQLVGEEQVRQFRAAIGPHGRVAAVLVEQVPEVHRNVAVREAAHVHDARCGRGRDQVDELAGQGEMAEVVDAHLALEAVRRARVRHGHDAGVVDEQVEALVALAEGVREAPDGVEAGQIELHEDGIGGGKLGPQRVERPLSPLGGAAGEHRRRALARQLPRRLETDAAVRARDDGDLSREIGEVVRGPALVPCGHLRSPTARRSP